MNVNDKEFAMLDEVVGSIYNRGIKDGSADVKMRVEGAYAKGLEDTWECANKINAMTASEFEEVFGYTYYSRCMEKMSPSEAMQKIKEYEERQKYAVKCEECAKAISAECVVDGCCEFEPKQTDATDMDDESIKVGDEVICYGTDTHKVVIEVIEISDFTKNESGNKQKKYYCFGNTGISTELDGAYKPKKTGRHFDAITEVLEQLRGDKG